VAWRDERSTDLVALEATLLDRSAGSELRARIFEDAAKVRLFVGWVALRCSRSVATVALTASGELGSR